MGDAPFEGFADGRLELGGAVRVEQAQEGADDGTDIVAAPGGLVEQALAAGRGPEQAVLAAKAARLALVPGEAVEEMTMRMAAYAVLAFLILALVAAAGRAGDLRIAAWNLEHLDDAHSSRDPANSFRARGYIGWGTLTRGKGFAAREHSRMRQYEGLAVCRAT